MDIKKITLKHFGFPSYLNMCFQHNTFHKGNFIGKNIHVESYFYVMSLEFANLL